MPVGLSPELAARQVLAWFDPSRAPRIEWSKIMRRSELLSAVSDDMPELHLSLAGSPWPVPTAYLPAVVVVVEASTAGMDSQMPWFGGAWADCRPVGEDQREHVYAVLDAETGRPLSAGPIDPPVIRAAADRWRDVPPHRFLVHASPTPTPSATGQLAFATPEPEPTRTPPGPKLTRANLPASMARLFRSYPLRPGSSWTWRITSREAGERWCAVTVTETVDAAWLAGMDHVVVKVDLEGALLTPPGACFVTSWPPSGSIYRDVNAGGVQLTEYAESHKPPPPVGERVVLEPLTDHLDPSSYSSMLDSIDEGAAVTTPAGSFDGCTLLHVVGGGSWGTYRWFCPGIGYVRDEAYGCSPSSAGFQVSELVRWTVADW